MKIFRLVFILICLVGISCGWFWNLGYYAEPTVDVEIIFNNDSTDVYEKVTIGKGSNCFYLYQDGKAIKVGNEIIKEYKILKEKND